MTQPSLPAEILEKRAAEQRRSLHNDVQLRSVVRHEVQERTDVKRNIRRHFAPIAGVSAVLALAVGYGAAGIFTRH
jgi:hypothetical protein